MKIYTKTGDSGETSLVGGKRVSKASLRVCAYGDMDELISYIGLLRCEIPQSDAFLRRVQAVLMTGSAHIASEVENPRLTPFPYEEIRTLEEEIDRLSALMPPMKSFVLPAGPAAAAHCHIARCVCRRSERSCVALGDHRPDVQDVIRYLNRLSDLLILFIFAAQKSTKKTFKVQDAMYWTLELASKLEDAPWPATKDELIDYATRSGAPLEVIENLEDLEDDGEVYESIEEIWPDYPSKEDFFFNEDEY